MNASLFLAPGFLWWLLMLLPVIALYFLKIRPRRHAIPSTRIWRLVLERIKPNSFIQRFQNSIFLFFQIFAISLAVFALARPLLMRNNNLTRIILIDISNSMQTCDFIPNRFSAARERARRLIREASGKVGLYTLGDSLRPAARPTDDIPSVLRALEAIQPESTSTPTPEHVMRGILDLEGLAPDEIYILTDTLDIFVPAGFLPRTALSVETFGAKAANIAITGADAEPLPGTDKLRVSLMLMNTGERLVSVSIRPEGPSQEGFPCQAHLSPGKETSVRLPDLSGDRHKLIVTAPDVDNANPADDVWYLSIPSWKPRLAVYAPPSSSLFRLGKAFPLIDVVASGQAGASGTLSGALAAGILPDSARAIPAAVFRPGPERVGQGEILPWPAEHPLTRYLDWDAAPLEALKPDQLPGVPIVRSISGTLLSQEISTRHGLPVPKIYIAINPDDPAFRDSIFLPVLLYNVVAGLLRDEFPRIWHPVGSTSLKALWKGAEPPRIAGFHTPPGKPDARVAINLPSAAEAFIAPARGQQPTASRLAVYRSSMEQASPWRWFLGLACAFVLGEWYLFLRRN